MERLAQQIQFVCELDKLKQVQRQTWITDTSRKENTAEHSWHIATMALVLAEYAPVNGLDVDRVIQMLLIHDIVEIDAGDTYCYDRAAATQQADHETRAAQRLFGLLPRDLSERFQALWEEFEARQTPEAQLANALDRLQPVLNNYHTGGKSWLANGITRQQVRERNRIVETAAPALWAYIEDLLEKAVRQGMLQD
ncbi:MAG: HD domain-containing protein [Desulfobacterales bacterium]|jgi:putative hydrolase of HD superfamily